MCIRDRRRVHGENQIKNVSVEASPQITKKINIPQESINLHSVTPPQISKPVQTEQHKQFYDYEKDLNDLFGNKNEFPFEISETINYQPQSSYQIDFQTRKRSLSEVQFETNHHYAHQQSPFASPFYDTLVSFRDPIKLSNLVNLSSERDEDSVNINLSELPSRKISFRAVSREKVQEQHFGRLRSSSFSYQGEIDKLLTSQQQM
eukprot:TRINITY_DN9966_c0_g1_i1.p1 TRINITY_DN9966_c0_g1~~TRINITY_DN9966_c0_g1_i1.p1  ORF type:complete len:205 (+),score=19.43 TRINITY_DN9966_c0_g1_i1:61-675(+)